MNIFGLDPDFYFGDVTYSPGGTFGPKLQPHLHLQYYYSGSVAITVAEKEYKVACGEAIMIPQGTRNFYQYSTTEKTRHGYCSLLFPRIDKASETALRRPPVIVPFSRTMRRLAEMGCHLRNATKPADLRMRANLGMAIMNAFLSDSNFLHEEASPLPRAVATVKAMIDTRYAEPLTLQEMAHAASLTKAHLIRLFSKNLNTSPIDYLWQVRVAQGIELIKSSGLRISEIADQTGFKSIFHFSRRISSACGISPSEIRKRQGLSGK